MAQVDPKSQFTWEFGRLKLSKLLKHYRELNKFGRKETQSKLQPFFKQYKDDSNWYQFRRLADEEIGGSILKLESGSTDANTIKIPDIQPLVVAYAIPHLLFSSLLSDFRKEQVFYIAHKPSIDFLGINQKILYHCGNDIQYYIPPTILQGTDSTHIIFHKLNPNGHSIGHRHPGQEFLYVVNGTIEVILHESGMCTELNAGDFIYIDANQLHSSKNRSDKEPAEVFVIRLTQLYRESKQNMNNEIAVDTKSKFQNLYEPNEVLDRYSLGRFLKVFCCEGLFTEASDKRVTIDTLVKRAKTLPKNTKHNYNRSKFSRIHQGKADITEHDLLDLAHIYEVDPLLLYNFVFPAFQHAIAVRPNSENSLKLVPSEILTCKNVSYEVPCCRLANSNSSIAIVTIGAKTETTPNYHPGWELLKVLEGEIVVELNSAQQNILKKGWYAHFYSHITHKIQNIGDSPAKIIVIRFFG